MARRSFPPSELSQLKHTQGLLKRFLLGDMTKMWKSLLVLLALATLYATMGEASLMGRGVLGRSRSRNNNKPWDDSRTIYYNNYYEDDEDQQNGNGENNRGSRRRPCVGICYYKKLLRLQNGEDPDDYDMEEEGRQRRRQRPCVGLCYHYKLLGIKNPFEKDRSV